MKNSIFNIQYLPLLFCIILLALCFFNTQAQSIRQDFPTPITTNEISGRVPARDIGDARLTTYFYGFNGIQGDVFVNVQTNNFNGDIEVFTAENLKSLTKITIYADISDGETGRVVYLRKPEKLILRIQGRSPNDDEATFRVKFAGSFVALPISAENIAPELPEVKSTAETDVRVNSVGTIIEVKPKPIPVPKEKVAKVEKPSKIKKPKSVAGKTGIAKNEEPTKEEIKTVEENPGKITIRIEKNAEEHPVETADLKETPKEIEPETSTKIVITDEANTKNADNTEPEKPLAVENTTAKTEESTGKESAEEVPATAAKKTVRIRRGKNGRIISRKVITPKPPAPNLLENIKLIVLLKDGTKIEHQMSDVLRFNIIKGVLTITVKGGKIERHSILDVEKTIIE